MEKKVSLTKVQFDKLASDIGEIKKTLEMSVPESAERYLDNQEFLVLMKVSKRTAQYWRAAGKIPFSRIGNKIYYPMSEVEKILRRQYFKSLRQLSDKPFNKKDLLAESNSKATDSLKPFKK